MKNSRGFTLIEILAVVIILGILMIVVVPSVTKYINSSRKEAYIANAKKYIEGSLFAIKKYGFSMSDKSGTYYISHECINLEKGGNSPFGEWKDAYVVMGYNNDINSMEIFWTSLDETGHGVDLTLMNDLNVDSIVNSIDEIKIESLPNRKGKIYILSMDGSGKCSVSSRESTLN